MDPEEGRESPSQFKQTFQPPAERFKINLKALLELVEELVEDANQKGCKVISVLELTIVNTYLTVKNSDSLIETFIDSSYPYWDKIHSKDEDFFHQNLGKIFGQLPKPETFTILAKAKDKHGNPIISDEYRDSIWSFIHSFVIIGIKYIHEKRIPDLIFREGKETCVYRRNYKPEIKLEEQGEKWKVKFIFSPRKT